MKSNRPIQLTEQDLHMLIEDAVRNYLINEGIDEGFWGGMKNLAQKGTQAMGNGISNMGKGLASKAQSVYNNAKTAATGAYDKMKTATTNAYNNAKTAYQQGSAQQDIQNVNNALQPMVQKGILGQRQYNTILGMLNKAIQAQGGQKMQGLA